MEIMSNPTFPMARMLPIPVNIVKQVLPIAVFSKLRLLTCTSRESSSGRILRTPGAWLDLLGL